MKKKPKVDLTILDKVPVRLLTTAIEKAADKAVRIIKEKNVHVLFDVLKAISVMGFDVEQRIHIDTRNKCRIHVDFVIYNVLERHPIEGDFTGEES